MADAPTTFDDCLAIAAALARRAAGPRRDLGEDLAQEAALALHSNWGRHDPARGSLTTWVTWVARGAFSNYLRGRRHRLFNARHGRPEASPLPPAVGAACGSPFAATDDADEFAAVMRRLPARHRRVLESWAGLDRGWPRTHGEIGALLGVSKQRASQLVAAAVASARRSAGL